MTINRSERRAFLKRNKILRKKSSMSYDKWMETIRNNIKEGNELHQSNVEANDKKIYEWYQEKENSIREALRAEGKTEEEIKNHLESWYDSIK